jgi:hypothetical protein
VVRAARERDMKATISAKATLMQRRSLRNPRWCGDSLINPVDAAAF